MMPPPTRRIRHTPPSVRKNIERLVAEMLARPSQDAASVCRPGLRGTLVPDLDTLVTDVTDLEIVETTMNGPSDLSRVHLAMSVATQIMGLLHDCGASQLEQLAALKIVRALIVVGPASYSSEPSSRTEDQSGSSAT